MGMFNKSLNAMKGFSRELHENMSDKPLDYAIGAAVMGTGNVAIPPWWSDRDSPYTNAAFGAVGGALLGGMTRGMLKSPTMHNLKNRWNRYYQE